MAHRFVRALTGPALALAFVAGASPASADHLADLRSQARAIQRDPEKVLSLARSLRQAGLFEEQTQVVRGAIARAPASPAADRLHLALARSYIDRGNQRAALAECDRLKKLAPVLSSVCAAEAQLLRKRGSVALPAAEEALQQAPKSYDAWVAKGRALRMLGKPREAEAALKQAVAIDPARFEAHYHLGEHLIGEKRAAEAVPVLRKARDLGPEEPEVLTRLASVLPRGQEAVDLLHAAVAVRPSHGDAHAELGLVLFEIGQIAEAEQSLRRALTLSPKEADWHVALGRVHLATRKPDLALNEATAALKIVANHAGAKLVEADALAAKGDIDLAIQSYEAAYGYARSDPTALVHAAAASLEGKRPTTAQAFADRATLEFPKWGPAWEVAGDVSAALGDKAAARQAYDKAISLGKPVDPASVRKKIAALK